MKSSSSCQVHVRVYRVFSFFNSLCILEADASKAADKIPRLVSKLPKSHKDTFLFVINHLLKIELYKDENRMDLHNLSVVWGPSLFWFPESCNSENLLKNSTNTVRVMELVLNTYRRLSSPTNKVGKVVISKLWSKYLNKDYALNFQVDSPINTHRKILNRSIESIISSSSTSPVLSRTDSRETISHSSDSISSKDYCLKSPMSGK